MFYANFIKLCGKIGKSPSAVAVELGFKKSTVTRWKSGSQPTDANAKKIADYFKISVSELLEDEKKPTPVSESGQEKRFSYLLELASKLPEEDLNTIEAVAKSLVERHEQKLEK